MPPLLVSSVQTVLMQSVFQQESAMDGTAKIDDCLKAVKKLGTENGFV